MIYIHSKQTSYKRFFTHLHSLLFSAKSVKWQCKDGELIQNEHLDYTSKILSEIKTIKNDVQNNSNSIDGQNLKNMIN